MVRMAVRYTGPPSPATGLLYRSTSRCREVIEHAPCLFKNLVVWPLSPCQVCVISGENPTGWIDPAIILCTTPSPYLQVRWKGGATTSGIHFNCSRKVRYTNSITNVNPHYQAGMGLRGKLTGGQVFCSTSFLMCVRHGLVRKDQRICRALLPKKPLFSEPRVWV
jgi:hypothetical protein